MIFYSILPSPGSDLFLINSESGEITVNDTEAVGLDISHVKGHIITLNVMVSRLSLL